MTTLKNLSLLCLVGGLSLASCSKAEVKPEPAKEAAEPAQPAAAASPDTGAEATYAAKTLFQTKCVVCHGSVGIGDGPGAAALTPKPRAFADATWQASVADEQIENTIVMGGAAVGKSPAMPGNPDLQSKPEVVKELVKIVRAFKKG
jgi:mono/diheme cytochrome c family protein